MWIIYYDSHEMLSYFLWKKKKKSECRLLEYHMAQSF